MNITEKELLFLILVSCVVWKLRKKKPCISVIYSIFLIIYITLIRRAPGYIEPVRFHIGEWKEAGFWAGGILNILLYVPFGYTCYRYITGMRKVEKEQYVMRNIVLVGACLSIACEMTQYITKRGCADINDVLFNILGIIVGVALAFKVRGSKY